MVCLFACFLGFRARQQRRSFCKNPRFFKQQTDAGRRCLETHLDHEVEHGIGEADGDLGLLGVGRPDDVVLREGGRQDAPDAVRVQLQRTTHLAARGQRSCHRSPVTGQVRLPVTGHQSVVKSQRFEGSHGKDHVMYIASVKTARQDQNNYIIRVMLEVHGYKIYSVSLMLVGYRY